MDNIRLYVRGGSGGMGLPRLGGQGGKGGDVWVVAKKNMTLKRIKDKHPQKRFVGGAGGNSRFVPPHSSCSKVLHDCEPMSALNVLCVSFILSIRALKGEMGKDTEILAPVGITVTTDEGKILGMSNASQHQIN